MNITRFLPSAALMPYVREYIIIESDLETGSKTIPDTSMVMAFRFKGNINKMEGGNNAILPVCTIAGLRKSVRIFQYAKETANLLVILKEGAITTFSLIPAHELFGLSIPAENVFLSSQLALVVELLSEANNHTERINIIEAFLLKKLVTIHPDPLIAMAIELINRQSGIIRIKDLAHNLHISQDAFEKRFRKVIGTSPKQFASIIRLRNLISKYSTYSSLTEASYDAGYFDQSHFIKDFRLFTGETPKDFFNSSLFW